MAEPILGLDIDSALRWATAILGLPAIWFGWRKVQQEVRAAALAPSEKAVKVVADSMVQMRAELDRQVNRNDRLEDRLTRQDERIERIERHSDEQDRLIRRYTKITGGSVRETLLWVATGAEPPAPVVGETLAELDRLELEVQGMRDRS